jgi:hypothetical protein
VQWDAFISHASEDKDAVVLPLKQLLEAQGLRVWVDKFQLTVGDSLRQAIERGLSESRFGIVVISPRFLEKEWTQAELDGLLARETPSGKVILPVWHEIDAATIALRAPMLAGRLAVNTQLGLPHVASELMKAIRRDSSDGQSHERSLRLTAERGAQVDVAYLAPSVDPGVSVRIELNPDHSIRTSDIDFEEIVTRLGVAAVDCVPMKIEVLHVGLDEYLKGAVEDPIARANYVAAWRRRAQKIERALRLLFSPPIVEAWQIWLGGVRQYVVVALEIIAVVGAGGVLAGTKIDVWRTDLPRLHSRVYLNSAELGSVLAGFGFNSLDDLAFGAGWRAADELPTAIITGRVLPQLLLEFERRAVALDSASDQALVLGSWHIGLG